MADAKIRKALVKDGIKPLRRDIPSELQSGKLTRCCQLAGAQAGVLLNPLRPRFRVRGSPKSQFRLFLRCFI